MDPLELARGSFGACVLQGTETRGFVGFDGVCVAVIWDLGVGSGMDGVNTR